MTRRIRGGLGRRAFLAASGGSALLLPFVPVLDSEAGGTGFPRRLILYYWPTGTVLENWRCSGGEYDFVLSPILAPLERHRDKLVILDGIDNEVVSTVPSLIGHPSIVSWWTGIEPLPGEFTHCTGTYGWAGGPSVDQYIADALTSATPVHSLVLGVDVETNDYSLPYSRPYYRGANEPVTPLVDPAAVWDYLFEGADLDPLEAARIRAGRQSVIDLVGGELDALSKTMGADERRKFEAHLEGLRAIERRVAHPLGAECTVPLRPESRVMKYYETVEVLEPMLDSMYDLVTSALTCDLTRVVALQGATEAGGVRLPQHNGEITHAISHRTDPEGLAMQTEVSTWWMDSLARLLDRLDAIPEGDGTLLDNTLVVAGCCIGDSWPHSPRNCPVVLAGGCGGAVTTGRYLRFGNYDVLDPSSAPHGGRTNNDLLVSICHAMGLTDVETFGNPSYCNGGIASLA
jgi:hypothetical protein